MQLLGLLESEMAWLSRMHSESSGLQAGLISRRSMFKSLLSHKGFWETLAQSLSALPTPQGYCEEEREGGTRRRVV